MNRSIRIAICDDEKNALSILSASIGQLFESKGIGTEISLFQHAKELCKELKIRSFDLLFLDICMPEADGVKLGEKILELSGAPDIIFVSSNTDRVFDTFSVNPFGFVRKDNFMKDISSVIKRYIEQKMNEVSEKVLITFKSENGPVTINPEQVKAVECFRNTQTFCFASGEKRELHSRMHTLEEQLKDYGFVRIHKGYLVNCMFVKRMDGSNVTLTSGETYPVGRSYHNDAMTQWMAFIRLHGVPVIG